MLQLQRLYGNRYVQRLVTQRQAEEDDDDTQAKPIQRMAVAADNDINTIKDAPFWSNFSYAQSQAPGAAGDMATNKVWDRLAPNEHIRIVQHGSPGKVNAYSAKQIADSMFIGSKVIPPSRPIGGVTFQSCFSDTPVVGGASLVSDMKTELAKHGYPKVNVSGKNGVAFNFKGMPDETGEIHPPKKYDWTNSGAEALWKNCVGQATGDDATMLNSTGIMAYLDAMYGLQNHKTPTGTNIFKSFAQFNDAWDIVGVSKMAWDGWTLERRGKETANAMESYWKEVHRFMKNKNALQAHPLSTLTKVLIGAGIVTGIAILAALFF